MNEPEKYRHLRFRMDDWSSYFVILIKEQQRCIRVGPSTAWSDRSGASLARHR